MKSEDQIQENEYGFPYHYIPKDGADIGFHRSWGWGLKYLGGIRLMLEKVKEYSFESLIEVGCGDGRLLSEIQKEFPEKRLKGIDYSERAIGFARAFNPRMDFDVVDSTANTLEEKFDFVVLSEVLEHIEPNDVPRFVESIANMMHADSHLLITVPHANQPVISKHFQHFSTESLNQQLNPRIEVTENFYFDRDTWFFRKLQKLFFNRLFLVSSRRLQSWLFNRYLRKNLKATESTCMRLGAICRLSK